MTFFKFALILINLSHQVLSQTVKNKLSVLFGELDGVAVRSEDRTIGCEHKQRTWSTNIETLLSEGKGSVSHQEQS
jgi:hypothetical protein